MSKAPTKKELERLREEVRLEEQRIELQEGLPFLHGWKWYPWAREFYESTNRINLLCAANQISKSSTQIRKCIDWATNTALWPELWKSKPNQFWYLYPTSKQAKIEFETKWKQFLPTGKFKEDPKYGWKEEFVNKELFAIHFFSGVHVYFKTYSQDTSALQTGTCDAIFSDEELPEVHYEELMFRLSASDGYFHMVFTATLGQEFWRLAMEPKEGEVEGLPQAFKQTVSMYDCMAYEDGTLSHWTIDKIKMVEARCRNSIEILKRVHGRFIKADGGRKYEAFDLSRHMKPEQGIPKDWLIYAGVDIGSGGNDQGHPSSICFIGVNPNMQEGRAFLGWRGDHVQTTAGDVVEKFIQMKKELGRVITGQYYDHACKDFEVIATRMNEPFLPANKSHAVGEQVLDTLFKNNMLIIHQTTELQKLGVELATLRKDTPKRKAKDDLTDALRYGVTLIPWDYSVIGESHVFNMENPAPPPSDPKPLTEAELMAIQVAERRKDFIEEGSDNVGAEDEINEWNEYYG